jgi:alpha-N-arabinofuranosidase
MLIQSTFYPFEMFSKRRNGTALRLAVDGPSYEGATNGCVHYIDASAILDGSRLHLFLTNRAMDENAEVCLTIADETVVSCESAEILTGADAKAANSPEDGEAITAKPFKAVDVKDGHAHCNLPPLSFVAMTLNLG